MPDVINQSLSVFYLVVAILQPAAGSARTETRERRSRDVVGNLMWRAGGSEHGEFGRTLLTVADAGCRSKVGEKDMAFYPLTTVKTM